MNAPDTTLGSKPRLPIALRGRVRWGLIVALLAAALSVPLFMSLVNLVNAPPRLLAPYIAKRAAGHRPVLVAIGDRLAELLLTLDRGGDREPGSGNHARAMPRLAAATAWSAPAPAGSSTPGSVASASSAQPAFTSEPVVALADAATRLPVVVASREALLGAIAHARPGDVISVRAGRYRFEGSSIEVARPGTAARPIVLRAERPGSVLLEMRTREGFRVTAPYWIFENLDLQGACAQHADCEHAFHVVGRAEHFTARGNTVSDFNAPFKINGEGGRFPDHGLIEHNTIGNTAARQTDQPVTMIDLVGASHWRISGNLIRDFIKAGGDHTSYGAFAKGGGGDNRFDGNIVLCEARLRGTPGARVGLSLGGGGTGAAFCRDSRCITEQEGSVIVSNLIASCSDDGIYLNRAAMSRIVHNTLIDTGGISVRYGSSSAEVVGNLVDGAIRSRDDALVHADDNLETSLPLLYLGQHPLRALFRAPEDFDFRWHGAAPRRSAQAAPPGLCGLPRPPRPAYGAFEDFSACSGGEPQR